MHAIWVVQGFMRFGGDFKRPIRGVEFWQVSGDCYRMISLFFLEALAEHIIRAL
jgi:hypothetical protein